MYFCRIFFWQHCWFNFKNRFFRFPPDKHNIQRCYLDVQSPPDVQIQRCEWQKSRRALKSPRLAPPIADAAHLWRCAPCWNSHQASRTRVYISFQPLHKSISCLLSSYKIKFGITKTLFCRYVDALHCDVSGKIWDLSNSDKIEVGLKRSRGSQRIW